MAEQSKITWTRSTFNPWIGCTKVAPGCDHCYAERQDARGIYGDKRAHWGAGVPRYRTAESTWEQVRKWNAKAPASEFAGRKGYWPVFTASLADVFDNEVPEAWRADYWKLVRECSNLAFLVVTKRIGNAKRMLPPDWGDGYPNVVLLSTIVNQEEADRDIVKLLATPARRRGLSMEPLLGPVDISFAMPWRSTQHGILNRTLDWVIVGGESGPQARPMHPGWARSLRDQCAAAGVASHFKQWGEWLPGHHYTPELQELDDSPEQSKFPCAQVADAKAATPDWSIGFVHSSETWDLHALYRVGVDQSGRMLDGVLHDAPVPDLEVAHA